MVEERKLTLSLPGSGLADVVFDISTEGEGMVQVTTINLKRSQGFTFGGGLKLNRQGAFNPRTILSVNATLTQYADAVRYRQMVLLQQSAPYLGEVVLTQEFEKVLGAEVYANRSVVTGSTESVSGLSVSHVAYKVFIQPTGDDADVFRFVAGGWYQCEFDAVEKG